MKLIMLFVLVSAAVVYVAKTDHRVDYAFAISNSEEYMERIEFLFAEDPLSYSIPMYGAGAGSYGQVQAISPELSSFVDRLNVKRGFRDTFFAKLFIEFGLFAYFLLIMVSVLYIRMMINATTLPMQLIAFVITFWIVLVVKGHPLIDDIYISAYIAVMVGVFEFFISMKKYENNERLAAKLNWYHYLKLNASKCGVIDN